MAETLPDHLPEEHREPHRALLTEARAAAECYDGTEDAYRTLMATTISLERWMVQTFGDSGEQRLPEADEERVMSEYAPDSPQKSIGALLDSARAHLMELLGGASSPDAVLAGIPVLHVSDARTILPPDERPRIEPGSGEGMRPILYSPRLQLLVQFLQQYNIFTDDLVAVTGENASNMMRRESYVLVEIPRINKAVLVCNVVGEATFVTPSIYPRGDYFQETKSQLQQRPGVVRIVFDSQFQWEHDLENALFPPPTVPSTQTTGTAPPPRFPIGPKIDVQVRETVREAILSTHTPTDWVHFTRNQKQNFAILGITVHRIGTMFGIDGAKSGFAFLCLGERIFGADNPVIREAMTKALAKRALKEAAQAEAADTLARLGDDRDLWRTELQGLFTPDAWLAISDKDRLKLRVHSLGHYALGRIMGVTRTRTVSALGHLELGAAIFGEDNPVIGPLLKEEIENTAKQKELGEDAELWKVELKKAKTAKQWAEEPFDVERRRFKLHGLGLNALSRFLGVPGNTSNDILAYLELGASVYGEDNPDIGPKLRELRAERKALEAIGNDADAWKAYLRKLWTADEMLAWKQDDKNTLKIAGKGLHGIASIIGSGGDPGGRHEDLLKLVRILFGEEIQDEIERETAREEARLRVLIAGREDGALGILKEAYPTADEWLALTPSQRGKTKLQEVGLGVYATHLGIEGPFGRSAQLRVALLLYPEERVRLEAELETAILHETEDLEIGEGAERWKIAVRKRKSPTQWIAMSTTDRREFSIAGRKMAGIARAAGSTIERPEDSHLKHLELGAHIYGDEPLILEALTAERLILGAAADLGTDTEKWSEALRGESTPEAWAAMSQKARSTFKLRGWTLPAIAKKVFGLNINPVGETLAHLEMGALLFGENHPAIAEGLRLARQKAAKRMKHATHAETLPEDPQELRTMIRREVPLTEWIAMNGVTRKSYRFHGLTLINLLNIFGLQGNPISNSGHHLELAAAIYGEDDPVLAAALAEARATRTQQALDAEERKKIGEGPDAWKAAIRNHYTAQQWAEMGIKERIAVEIAGIRISSLANLVGATGNPRGNTLDHLRMGAIVYGANDPVIAPALAEEEQDAAKQKELGKDPGLWRTALSERTTVDALMGLNGGDSRLAFKCHGVGLVAIARIFGIAGDPIHRAEPFEQIARAIFGDAEADRAKASLPKKRLQRIKPS